MNDQDADLEQLPTTSNVVQQRRGDGSPLGAGSEDRLIRWSNTEKTTPLAPLLPEWIARVKTIREQALRMAERIRCSAQPNRAFRRERLVPSDVNALSERVQFAMALEEFRPACFDTLPQLRAYTKRLMDIELEIEKSHDLFLRQVMKFSVKPLLDYVKQTSPEILLAHSHFMKNRDRYDAARRKPKSDQELAAIRAEFAASGRVLLTYLLDVPNQQMALARAIDSYLRAELEFSRNMLNAAFDFKAPDHVVWWSSEEHDDEK